MYEGLEMVVRNTRNCLAGLSILRLQGVEQEKGFHVYYSSRARGGVSVSHVKLQPLHPFIPIGTYSREYGATPHSVFGYVFKAIAGSSIAEEVLSRRVNLLDEDRDIVRVVVTPTQDCIDGHDVSVLIYL
jgi:hypothetical protein